MRVRLGLGLGVPRREEVLDDPLSLRGGLGEVVRLNAAEVLDDAVEKGRREGEEREDLLLEGRVVGEVLGEFERKDVLGEVENVLVRLGGELVDPGRVKEAAEDVAECLLGFADGESLHTRSRQYKRGEGARAREEKGRTSLRKSATAYLRNEYATRR